MLANFYREQHAVCLKTSKANRNNMFAYNCWPQCCPRCWHGFPPGFRGPKVVLRAIGLFLCVIREFFERECVNLKSSVSRETA